MLAAPLRRKDSIKSWLHLFHTLTGLPVSLYEVVDDTTYNIEPLTPYCPSSDFCKLIQKNTEGQRRCIEDQKQRALNAILSIKNKSKFDLMREPVPCHAGLYNYAVPIVVGNRIRGVLLYGEMLLEGSENQKKSESLFKNTVSSLRIPQAEVINLEQALNSMKLYNQQQIASISEKLLEAQGWLYRLLHDEDEYSRNVVMVVHELETRIVAVISNAENLSLDAQDEKLSLKEVAKQARNLLSSILSLDTVLQNIGDSLEAYHYRKESVIPLLLEASEIYQAEADRRNIEIRMRVTHAAPSGLEIKMSKTHLQYAFNNLVHNAIKYSFSSGPGRSRYVDIVITPHEKDLKIYFENYGIGILPREIRSGAIFEDGYQGELTTDEYRKGLGKGLSFVKRVIEKHGGTIEVTSDIMADADWPERQPHKTRFTVNLPY